MTMSIEVVGGWVGPHHLPSMIILIYTYVPLLLFFSLIISLFYSMC